MPAKDRIEVQIRFERWKVTQNKFRYKEVPDSEEAPPVIGDLYVSKWIFGMIEPPDELIVSIWLDRKPSLPPGIVET